MPTGEFHIIEHPHGERVVFVPDRDTPLPTIPPPSCPVCLEHSGIVVRLGVVQEQQAKQAKEITSLRLLPWKVVGAALGAGASIAAIVEAARAVFG